MRRVLFGVTLGALVAGATLSAAPKSTSASAIILNTPAQANRTAASSDSTWVPSLGDSVNFTTQYPSSLEGRSVSIQVLCYQNGSIVFATAGLHDRSFQLGGTSSPWLLAGGDATCKADLYYWSTNGQRMNILASTEFDAAG